MTGPISQTGSVESKPTPVDEPFRDYAISHFELHAGQRLQAFQFYVTLSTALIGGFLLLLRYDKGHKWMSILGLVLAFLSFVFWKLDERTRQLVKRSEEALKFLDEQYELPDIDGAPHPLRLFSRDDYFTDNAKVFPLWSGQFSYTRCFRWVFTVFACLGVSVAFVVALTFPS